MQLNAAPDRSGRGVLEVRVATNDQLQGFDGLLADHHYLGAGRPVGDYLRQVVLRDQQPVALLVGGPVCYALKDRDRWISWSATQRLERLKLIVRNRRFLVLAGKGQSPNRPGAHAHGAGAPGRATGDRRDRALCHHPQAAAAPPPESAAQERHALPSSARLRHVLSSAHPDGPRSVCEPAQRLVAAPRRDVARRAGPGRQNHHRRSAALPARAHARVIVEKGGEYLFQIKGNQPNLLNAAQGLDALQDTPFLPTANPDTAACKRGGSTPSTPNRSPQTSPLPER